MVVELGVLAEVGVELELLLDGAEVGLGLLDPLDPLEPLEPLDPLLARATLSVVRAGVA